MESFLNFPRMPTRFVLPCHFFGFDYALNFCKPPRIPSSSFLKRPNCSFEASSLDVELVDLNFAKILNSATVAFYHLLAHFSRAYLESSTLLKYWRYLKASLSCSSFPWS